MLKNVLVDCKIYNSPADWLYTNNYELIYFLSLISSLVAGVNFAKRYRNRVLYSIEKLQRLAFTEILKSPALYPYIEKYHKVSPLLLKSHTSSLFPPLYGLQS